MIVATLPSDKVDVIVCVINTGVVVIGRPSLFVVVKTTVEMRVVLYWLVLDRVESSMKYVLTSETDRELLGLCFDSQSHWDQTSVSLPSQWWDQM